MITVKFWNGHKGEWEYRQITAAELDASQFLIDTGKMQVVR